MGVVETAPGIYQSSITAPEIVEFTEYYGEIVPTDYTFDGCCSLVCAIIELAKEEEPEWFGSDEYVWYREFFTGRKRDD